MKIGIVVEDFKIKLNTDFELKLMVGREEITTRISTIIVKLAAK